MNNIPFIDWNHNGKIDPSDIAISLAISEETEKQEKDKTDEEENDDTNN